MIRGQTLMIDPAKITDDQIVMKEPKIIEFYLYRNDEENTYEINVGMPWGNWYTLESYDDYDRAMTRYEELVKKMQKGKAVIEIGETFAITVKQ